MRNRYPGVCYRCGKNVPPGAGYFEQIWKSRRKGGQVFQVQHVECCAIARQQKAGTDSAPAQPTEKRRG